MEQTPKISNRRGRKPCGIPYEERKAEYNKAQYERNVAARKKAKEIKKNEDITKQRLYFLTHIIKSQGLNWGDVSRITGMSQQALSWIIIKDDTKLSNVKKILHALGMEILPEFATKDKEATAISLQNDNYELVGEIPSIRSFVALDPIVNISLRKNDDLAFLARFLTESRITLSQLSDRTGISVASLKNCFNKENIHVSTLYTIAEAYETKIIWRVKALPEAK